MKKIFKIFLSVLLVISISLPINVLTKDKKTINVSVDPRMELLSIVQLLSDYPILTRLNFSYKQEIMDNFSSLKYHNAVSLFKEMARIGFSFDAPPTAMLFLSDPPELKNVIPFTDYILMRAGGKEKLDTFIESLRDFATKSDFMKFYSSHNDLYSKIINDVKSKMNAEEYIELLESYYGVTQNSYNIIATPLFHCGGYGPNIECENGLLDIYSIIGPCDVKNSIPIFGSEEDFKYITWHEFSHSFVNPVTNKYKTELNKYSKLFSPISEKMSNMAYGDWIICVNEHLVRAIVARFNELKVSTEEANSILREEINLGFVYIEHIYNLLKSYESNRNKYPTFADFYPEIVLLFKKLSELPLLPTNLSSTNVSVNGVNLKWDDNSRDEDGFKVYRKEGENSDFTLLATLKKNTEEFEDIDIKAGKKYSYKVSSFNSNGENFAPLPVYVTVPKTKPSKPENFSVTSIYGKNAKFAWEYSKNTDGFTIYELLESERIKIIDSDKNKREVEIPDIPYGKHTYVITSYFELDNSEKLYSKDSELLNFTILKPPSNLLASALDSKTVKLEWINGDEFAETIKIFRKSKNETEFIEIAKIKFSNKFIDEKCKPETIYLYYLESLLGDNIASEKSNIAEVATPKEVKKIVIRFYIGKEFYYLNDERNEIDVAPIILEGRTFLPIRYVADAIGAETQWFEKEQKIQILLKNIMIELWIGKNIAKLNGVEKLIDPSNPEVKPVILPPGRTMLPVRFVVENLGCKVDWDPSTQEVKITYEF